MRGQKVLLCPGMYIPMDETISHTRTRSSGESSTSQAFGIFTRGHTPWPPVSSSADWLACLVDLMLSLGPPAGACCSTPPLLARPRAFPGMRCAEGWFPVVDC